MNEGGSFEEFGSSNENGQEFGQEKIREKESQYKEKAKATFSKIQKVARDEKKAQKNNQLLYEAIVYFLEKNTAPYEEVVYMVSEGIEKKIPAFVLLGILSLLYEPISVQNRNTLYKTFTGDKSDLPIFQSNPWFAQHFSLTNFQPLKKWAKNEEIVEQIEFDDNNIPNAVKERINEWVNDMLFVFFSDSSLILLQKTKRLFENSFFIKNEEDEFNEEQEQEYLSAIKQKKDSHLFLQNFIAQQLKIFLYEKNISISQSKAHSYAKFIFEQLSKNIKNINVPEVI